MGQQRTTSQSKVRPTSCRNADSPHDAGHIKSGIPRPSDTCPHTCVILNQNINGLGNKDNKLEKIIERMIERKMHGYYIQETWQLGSYTKTIREHTTFPHNI